MTVPIASAATRLLDGVRWMEVSCAKYVAHSECVWYTKTRVMMRLSHPFRFRIIAISKVFGAWSPELLWMPPRSRCRLSGLDVGVWGLKFEVLSPLFVVAITAICTAGAAFAVP